ncbi:hypothetical protein ASPZODRAFT_127656 [Penicilliopsis zonata CBS 506.65]|uniref:J domain-containing protein n=1 Tax=Penicilliopsis zonata CBS 506.65 TaxID=1073090 RepID=A0A1L9SWJ2_9EURO|nr:hypothetical protein ASPZODRAFT_127656 [Penicilliopsis zonata CBS 506.65]OJJ51565.1 hypothetical protein ASPZODRAFT_127656 [Penicilliopsis zonata CBS 506.65]
MLKKHLLIGSGGLPPLLNPCLSSSPPRPHPPRLRPGRFYATQSPAGSAYTWPTHSGFTPYDVFHQKRGDPYSKSRFYELVKVYHPDRSCNGHPLCREISPEVRLYRYRLLVTAHEILSDPEKRAAYDQSGTGWAHSPDAGKSSPSTPSYRYGERDYGPIYSNATWEDWEKWHNRHQPKQRHSVDNRTFTAFIVLLTLLGGALHASWISQYSSGYEQRLREINEESMRFLTGRRHQTVTQMDSTDARVQGFLMRRDPSGYGLKEEEEQVYRKALDPRQRALEASDEMEESAASKSSDH